MKTILYYFTGTGNTLAIARDLAAELGGADIVPIVKAVSDPASNAYDAVGVIYPVYMFGLPLIVAKFLRHFAPPKDAYIFSVANFGGMQGRANQLVAQILRQKGLKLSAAYGFPMPNNYTPLGGALEDAKQKAMFDNAKKQVKRIAAAVQSRTAGIMECDRALKGVLGLLIYLICYPVGCRMVPNEDRHFWVTAKCVHCGLCAKVCPVCNITMQDGKPVWLHHCQTCMACLQWCPSGAIEFGKSTVGRKRYHHPACKPEDVEAQKR